MHDLLTLLRKATPQQLQDALQALSPAQCEAIRHDWRIWARPEQLEPGSPGAAPARNGVGEPLESWRKWLLLAGRMFGKTRTGAEWAIEQARLCPNEHGALIAPTMGDTRRVMLSEGTENAAGASGILAVSPPAFRPIYEPSKFRLTWPNGAVATCYSADEPERLRGPQHGWAWCDEIAAWRYEETWDMMLFGLRLGHRPRVLATTTPKAKPLIKQLLTDPRVCVTRGRSRDNVANVAASVVEDLERKYGGTRLGRQELDGELLEKVEGALWSVEMIDGARRASLEDAMQRGLFRGLQRIVVAIDPQASDGTGATDRPELAETGIVGAGAGLCSCLGKPELHAFVLEDLSGSFSPAAWGKRAIDWYKKRRADRILAEKNNGGAMVENTIRSIDRSVSYASVWASKGKQTRAEPVAALYEQGKVHHVGTHQRLEDQQCAWAPLSNAPSPNRVDALVWAITELILEPSQETTASLWSRASL